MSEGAIYINIVLFSVLFLGTICGTGFMVEKRANPPQMFFALGAFLSGIAIFFSVVHEYGDLLRADAAMLMTWAIEAFVGTIVWVATDE